ncbi:MAG: glutathione S-transferase [Rhodospirillales bacterium]|nr:glutathione S-transferase [Rhodospirillales bacterium]
MSRFLYHMASRSDWDQAETDGFYRGSADDRRDGFMHFSTAEQVAESARRHRPGQADLVLIVVAEDGTGPWRWEPARSGDLFPHLYADLPVKAVVGVHDLSLGDDGLHVFPPLM